MKVAEAGKEEDTGKPMLGKSAAVEAATAVEDAAALGLVEMVVTLPAMLSSNPSLSAESIVGVEMIIGED